MGETNGKLTLLAEFAQAETHKSIAMAASDLNIPLGDVPRWLGERVGSGDGEHKTLLTRQIAFKPLRAFVCPPLGDCELSMVKHIRRPAGNVRLKLLE